MNDFSRSTILVTRNGMGHGDNALQQKLMIVYLTMLVENNYTPGAICFYSEGVFLVLENSSVIDQLKTLAERGTQLIICNTCLKHYNKSDQVAIGITGGMHDIIEAQRIADKVITL